MSDSEIVVTKVKTYDGSPAYKLPNGTIVTVEAWESIEPEMLRAVIARDAERKPSD